MRSRLESLGLAANLAPLLNLLLPFDIPETQLTAQMSGPIRADNLVTILGRLLDSALADSPTLMAIEDLHWMDDASLALCADLGERHERVLLLIVQAYCTAMVCITINFLRAIGSHRWENPDGREMTFVEQMLDTVTIDSDLPWESLINPLGLRYHAAHHMFPGIPFHNLRAAHLRLREHLPPDSPYHRTLEPSLFRALVKLWGRARESVRR